MTSAVSRRWLRRSILVFAAIAPLWTIIFFRVNLVAALAPLFVSHLLLLYPTLVPQSQWWGPVQRLFATSRREVWITIDDGPTPAHTEKILDLLERYKARATFFVIGSRALKFPHLLEQILTRGHQVANHTFTHPSGTFWCASPSKIASEIDRCDATISQEGESRGVLFRAPAGLKNPFVHPVLARRGMKLVAWSARGFDTSRRDPGQVAERILRQARPGAIVLLHEGHRVETDPNYNPACVERTLKSLAEFGYEFVIPKPEQLRAHVDGK